MQRTVFRSYGVLLALLALSLASCATGGAGATERGDPDIITREEIDQSPGSRTAYELIQRLRPQWLITRGIANVRQGSGAEDIVVYMDNARMGYREALRSIPLGSVRYLEFFDARRATQRWGGGHIHGAILISTTDR